VEDVGKVGIFTTQGKYANNKGTVGGSVFSAVQPEVT
jgi:hypothetical protein